MNHHKRHLGRVLPLPLGGERGLINEVSERFIDATVGAIDSNNLGEELCRNVRSRCFDDVHASRGAARCARGANGVDKQRHQVGRSIGHDAAHVERVAHFAIERIQHRVTKAVGVGCGGGHHPCPTRAMQAHRNTGLASHGPQLSNCLA